jgi:hypothetical protein
MHSCPVDRRIRGLSGACTHHPGDVNPPYMKVIRERGHVTYPCYLSMYQTVNRKVMRQKPMPLSEELTWLAVMIYTHVKQVLAGGGGD